MNVRLESLIDSYCHMKKNKKQFQSLLINRDQRLKDVLDIIPTDTILFKVLTGIGATTLELEAQRNSIIIEPNVPVITGKCDKYNTKRKINVRGVYEGVNVNDIVSYLESGVKFKKILVTPESFMKVKEAMDELDIDMYKTYTMIIDECERTIQDVGYRKNIILPMNDFFRFESKSFISATPIIPSDPRFNDQNFKHLYIKPNFYFNEDIKLIETNNVLLTLGKFINENPREQYFIFFNSTDTIAYFIDELGIKEESSIFCAKESMQKLKVNDFTKVSTSLGKFSKFNWLTSRFFSAVDIEKVVDPTIIMISDLVSAQHSMIDPLSEAVQIVGRFRKPDKGKINKEIIHITNVMPELTVQTEEEVKEYIKECQVVYRVLQRYLKASTTHGAISTLKEILQRIEFAKYINKDGSRNYFMQDNTIFEEKVKGYYQSVKNLITAYKVGGHFQIEKSAESYKYTDKERFLSQMSIPLKSVYSVIMPMLKELHDPEITSTFQRDLQMMQLRKEFRNIVSDFDKLGYEVVKSLDFNPKKIRDAVREKDKKDLASNFGLLHAIENSFKEGEVGSSQTLVARLKNCIAGTQIRDLSPSIKLLKQYCELSNRMFISKGPTGKNIMGYRILKIKDKLKN